MPSRDAIVPVIAVINRKGGSGKSTVATHIAAHLARNGSAVMLGDVDRQQSLRAWLKRRGRFKAEQVPAIQGWVVDRTSVARPPAGITHLVLDTPGGLTGFDLARVVMWSDAIVMPVCDSAFDRESAAACHAELIALPRVAGGRCRIGVVGMRIDRRTRGNETLQAWAAEHGMRYLGSLRDTQLYVSSAERGLTLFDLPPAKAAADLEEWAPLLDWLRQTTASKPRPAASPVARPAPTTRTKPVAAQAPRPRIASLSVPPTLDADLSSLTLSGVARPGFWSSLRRLFRV